MIPHAFALSRRGPDRLWAAGICPGGKGGIRDMRLRAGKKRRHRVAIPPRAGVHPPGKAIAWVYGRATSPGGFAGGRSDTPDCYTRVVVLPLAGPAGNTGGRFCMVSSWPLAS